jgi:transcriptional regulator with XRE-family HTH domain
MKEAIKAATQLPLAFDRSSYAKHRAALGRDAGNLIDMRRASGLTQRKFAAAIGVSRGTLAHWENERAPVPASVASVAAQVMSNIDWGQWVTKAEVKDAGLWLWTEGETTPGAERFRLARLKREDTPKGLRYQ